MLRPGWRSGNLCNDGRYPAGQWNRHTGDCALATNPSNTQTLRLEMRRRLHADYVGPPDVYKTVKKGFQAAFFNILTATAIGREAFLPGSRRQHILPILQ